ncbi:YesL family protein [Fictibacillus terranigra]|uniref:YesL family protein n=1 Tax=Fictibacillus terranigra TaxID=3058424 RepID=A0ABT8E500_9BACL|nr:YesL family protein [Fictibacillus sp. CENA-BCM004]MDN4072986.1 YesL family protein [Fictibacillus sp. CENA-BCM004]
MNINRLGGFVYWITEWIMRLAYVQFLWIVFIILGLGVFGFFPSTAAMFSVTRKWVSGEGDIPIFITFWQSYKKEFFKVNTLGWILLAMAYFLYSDFKFFTFGESTIFSIFKIIISIVFYLFLTMCIYFFPIYVHFQYKFLNYIKYSFLYSFVSPMKTVGLFLVTIGMYYLFLKMPVLFLFFSGSTISFVWMSVVYKVLEKGTAKSELSKNSKSIDKV